MPIGEKKTFNFYYKANAKKAIFSQHNEKYEPVIQNGQQVSDSEFSGYLRNVSVREGEFEKKPVYSVRLEFGRESLEEVVEFGLNSACLSLLNTLSNKDLNGKCLTVRMYKAKDETTGEEYRGSNVYIELAGEKIGWEFKYQQVAKLLDQDKTKVIKSWKDMIASINEGLTTAINDMSSDLTEEMEVETKTVKKKKATPVTAGSDTPDDLPF